MFNRQRTNADSRPDLEGSREPSLRSAAADSAWLAQDRVKASFAGALERLAWVFQRGLIWPLQDRLGGLDGAGRGLAFAAAIVLAAGAGVAGLLWAAPDRPDPDATAPVAVVSQASAEVPVPPVAVAAAPTLEGATPVFEHGKGDVAKSRALASQPAESEREGGAGGAAGATEKASSTPSASTQPVTAARASSADGPPAGPAAVAVAREFADAFVLYETGNDEGSVRKAFAATASPRLSRSLLRRPPRLPANVKVPQAKVVNVVPGPSRGGVYTISVALLRVGLTSELRLDMERQKDKRWLVTNVLG